MVPVQAIGKYYDGVSGKPHEVMIGLSGSSLRITSSDGSLEKSWSFNEIEVLEDALPPQPAKLTSKKEPDTRLYINPDHGWIRIKDKLPRTAFPKISLSINWFSFIGYFSFSIAIVIFIIFSAPKLLENAGSYIPQSLENKLGEYVINSIVTDNVCTSPKGQAALNTIITRLQSATEREIDFTIYVVDDSNTLNALAAPGAHLILFSGIIEKAETPEEIAGVLAHEMAHIELYHPTRGLMRDLGLSMILSMMTGSADIAQFAGTLTAMSYSRDDESAADKRGQYILAASDLDPKSMALFFEHLLEDGNKEPNETDTFSAALSYLSTHPQTTTRINEIRANTYLPEQTRPLLNNKEFEALKNICNDAKDDL